MLRTLVIASVVGLLLSAGVGWAYDPANPFIYTGSLSWTEDDATGLNGTGVWATFGTSLAWNVTSLEVDDEGYLWWSYDYTLTLGSQQGATSHFILETSTTLSEGDIDPDTAKVNAVPWDFLGPTTYTPNDVDEEGGKSNPGMPGNIFGIKFDNLPENNGQILKVYFESRRTPVWSDFYAKDGQAGGSWNAIWNAGFLTEDPSIQDYPRDEYESALYHILAPDTASDQPPVPPVTPELPPGALLLLTLIPAAWAGRRKRR